MKFLPIAKNTFRETIRDKVLVGIVGFAILYILLTIFMGKLALGDMVMIRSFGLAGVYIFGLITTIFLGASILHKEIDRRTLYFVLSKPVSRLDVVLGKFLGLFGAVALTTFLMAVVYAGVIAYQGGGFDVWGLVAIAFQVLELALFTALLLCLSAVTAPLIATIAALMVLFVGHLSGSALVQAKMAGGLSYRFVQFVYYLLPNLEKFNIRNYVVHEVALPPAQIGITFLYGAVYISGLLVLAYALFRKREL